MTIKFWTMGSLANAGWKSIILPAVVVIAVTLFSVRSIAYLIR